MPSILSKLIPYRDLALPFNCYEVGHTWTPSCSRAALDIGSAAFVEALKMYAGLYMFSQLVSGRYDVKSFRETAKSVLRSSTFIGLNAYSVLILFCFSFKCLGKLYLSLIGHLPSIVGSFMSIHVEKPSRRGPLAFYVANIAAETVYRLLVSKKLIKPLPHGEVILFTTTMTFMMYFIKKNGFSNDAISNILKFIIGKDQVQSKVLCSVEPTQAISNSSQGSHLNGGRTRAQANKKIDSTWLYKIIASFNSFSSSPSPWCSHNDKSCLVHSLNTFAKRFLLSWPGYGLFRTAIRFRPSTFNLSSVYDNLVNQQSINFGLFVASFATLFRLSNCILGRVSNGSQNWHASVGGLIAGLSMILYPNKTIAQYTFWKMIELAFWEAVKNKKINNADLIITLLYATSCSQLFFVAVISPENLRPSYMRFLDRFTHHALHLLNRNIIDLFGTHSSSGFKVFLPNLDLQHTSRQFQEAVMVWTIQ